MSPSLLRDLGLLTSSLPAGLLNAITDVTGVRVGHTTLISGSGTLQPGLGPVRTGVTVILPHGENLFEEKVCAAVHTINGFGKPAGFEQVRELGRLEAPIALTNTLNVGLVLDALVQHAIRQNPGIGVRTGSVNVVVGETNDGYLNDLQGRHVHAEHVFHALESASPGPVLQGAIGAGTGTCCLGWKGGIGCASRRLPDELGSFTLGALVQSNFGAPGDLLVCGLPVGRRLSAPAQTPHPPKDGGSIMIVLACDAPLSARQLGRLCARATAGLARVGSFLGHGSGDFVIAFSTARRLPHQPERLVAEMPALLDEARLMPILFRAVVESVEEAILNSLCAAETMEGRDGHVAYGLPIAQVAEIVKEHFPGSDST
ncbi:MAG: P1 family peptidase [Chloroflexota bacterium]